MSCRARNGTPHERDAARQSADRPEAGPRARRVRALARGLPPDRRDAPRRRRHPSARDARRRWSIRAWPSACARSALQSFRDYCALVAGAAGLDERQKMLAALTTNVTRFFREPHHFEHLERVVLPPLLSAARQGGRVRLWSAACSNGQEPYSMAMTILSMMPDAARSTSRSSPPTSTPTCSPKREKGVYAESFAEGAPANCAAAG